MALFGLRADKTLENQQQDRLYAARNAYDERRTHFCDAGKTLEVECQSGQDWLPAAHLRLRIDAEAFVLFPEVNAYDVSDPESLDGLTEIVLPRAAYRLEHTSPVRQPVQTQGERLLFSWPAFQVTLAGPRSAVLRTHNLSRACAFFAGYPDAVSVRPLFDLWDGPSCAVVFEREHAAPGEPAGRYDMWREGDDLYFYQEPGPYRRKPEYLEIWHWPLTAVTYFQARGDISHDYITSGGDVEFDASAAWRPHWTHVGFLEDAISVTPVRTQKIERDERYTELVLQKNRVFRLSFDSLDSLRALMPEKEFDRVAV